MTDADYELWAAMMADDEEASASVVTAPVTPAPVPVVTITPPAPEQYLPVTPVVYEAPAPVFQPPVEEVPNFVPSIEDVISADEEFEEELEFPTGIFKEPQTNSITIAEVPDALNADIVSESGEVLKTGAIDIPLMTNTGSIPIITAVPEEVDEQAITADMGWETTGGIPPIRSGSVMNSSARVGVLPIKNRRSEGQTILLATISILLVGIGAALIAAYMFKLI